MNNDRYYKAFSLPHDTFYGETTKKSHPNPYIQIGLNDIRGGVLGEFKLVWTDNGIQLQAYQDSWKIFCYMKSLFNVMDYLSDGSETVEIHKFAKMLKTLGFTDTTEYTDPLQSESSDSDAPIVGFRGDYYFLSNFFKCPVKYCGLTYRNSEAAFQAQKCLNSEDCESYTELSGTEAKNRGGKVKLTPHWENMKQKYMYDICKAKFEQNPDIRQKLLDTGNRHLEECNTWNDRYWGTVNGKGENNLGKILMRIRDELRK